MQAKDVKRRWRPGMLLGISAVLVASALVLAACGGGSSSSEGSTSSEVSGGEASGPPGAFNISEEQRACLKEKGVELPEFKGGEGKPPQGGDPPEGGELPEGAEPPQGGELPEGAPGGEQFDEQQGAFQECGVEIPEFKGGPGGAGAPNTNSAAFKKQVNKYVACVRENGYELAEPDFSGNGPIFEKAESESAAFKKASAQCQGLLGGPQGGQSG
jgi:hypothetical protein